jgi:hypothetical protein
MHKAASLDGEEYEIRVKGHLGDSRARGLEGMSVSLEPNGETVIRGCVADQAALFGLLIRIRDLGLPLLLVRCTEYTRCLSGK